MQKTLSYLWAFAVGALLVALSFALFLLRFGELQVDAAWMDFLLIFLAGSLIGVVLVYFLRRSETQGISRGILIGFGVSLPLAMFGVVLGGMLGWIGIFLLGVSPSVFAIGVGYYLGRAFLKP